MAAPQSTPLPPAPVRNEPEAVFIPKSNAFLGALEPLRVDLQAQADYVNTEITGLAQAVTDAQTAATAAGVSETNAAASESAVAADALTASNAAASSVNAKNASVSSANDASLSASDSANAAGAAQQANINANNSRIAAENSATASAASELASSNSATTSANSEAQSTLKANESANSAAASAASSVNSQNSADYAELKAAQALAIKDSIVLPPETGEKLSFDSLTSAIATISSSPTLYPDDTSITTASYRSSAECATLGVAYPDGGGASYVVDSGAIHLIESSTMPLEVFGGVAKVGLDNASSISLAEESSVINIDLGWGVFESLSSVHTLSKNYTNGSLVGSAGITNEIRKPTVAISDYELAKPRSKSPLLEWNGKNVLWLGTSIPHQGVGLDSYPELTCTSLGATCQNWAWSGSSVRYEVDEDAFAIGTVKRLSMTEDDRLAGLALYGNSSAYNDSFNPITKASEMTCDARIKAQFQEGVVDVVVLDHNHNDRTDFIGTLDAPSKMITTVTKGTQTEVILEDVIGLSVGDAITVFVNGISRLNSFSGRVQSISGNSVFLNVDSTTYTGSFISGHTEVLDKGTLYGSFTFLVNYINWCANDTGQPPPIIIFAGAPSEFTNGVPDNTIWSIREYIYTLAKHLGISFFDIAHAMEMTHEQHSVYFPDEVHPTTTATRSVISTYWVEWLTGGAGAYYNPQTVLKTVGAATPSDGASAKWWDVYGGYEALSYEHGEALVTFEDDFLTGDLSKWKAAVGTAPLVEAAPWGSGNAIKCQSVLGGDIRSMLREDIAGDEYCDVSFDFYLPTTSGLTDKTGNQTIGLMSLGDVLDSQILVIELLVNTQDARIRASVYQESPLSNPKRVSSDLKLLPNTKYTLKALYQKAKSGQAGSVVVYMNGNQLIAPFSIQDATQNTMNQILFGVIGSSTDKALELYVSNYQLNNAPLLSTSDTFTGTFTEHTGKTVTVSSGVIRSVV